MSPNTTSIDTSSLIPIIEGLQSPWELQAILLFVTFTVHLILANTVLGFATFSLVDRIFFKNNEQEQDSVHLYSVLIPKGLAFVVNFAIPPLLFLQGIYGQFIYTSSILMGLWWLAIMALVIFAYYGLYLHTDIKNLSYTNQTVSLAASVIILAFIAFLLVNNVTLMSSPEKWILYSQNSHGTFLNVYQSGIIPRYLHIILASLAIGGLIIATISHYIIKHSILKNTVLKNYFAENITSDRALPIENTLLAPNPEDCCSYYRVIAAYHRKNRGLKWFIYATLCQIPVGIWFLLTLPQGRTGLFLGGSVVETMVFILALIFAGISLYKAYIGRLTNTIGFILVTIFLMSFMRTLLRSSLLEPYYVPSMRSFSSGPLLFFAACTVGSILLLTVMVKLYRTRGSMNKTDGSAFLIDAIIETKGETAFIDGLHDLYKEHNEVIGSNMPQERS